MIKVGIIPNFPQFEGDRLFALEHEYSGYWQQPFAAMREHGRSAGFEIRTMDMWDEDVCDIVVLMDLPSRQQELPAILRRAPRAKWILHLVESPLGKPYFFDPRNHRDFAAIVTYHKKLCDERRYFHCPFPVGVAPQVEGGPTFSARRLLLIVNNVGRQGIWAHRGHGLRGLPFIGSAFSGYRMRFLPFLRQFRGELHSRRLSIARKIERRGDGLVSIYGNGWNGESIGWVNRFVRSKPFRGFKGRLVRQFEIMHNYRFVLAFENVATDTGFITQKLFDAMHAGVVPVYQGDAFIEASIPKECYVDARQFSSDDALIDHLMGMDEAQWQAHRTAGAAFLASTAVRPFTADYYAECWLKVLRTVIRSDI